jgi:hypothetical protein
MNLKESITQMQGSLSRLAQMDLGYPFEGNQFFSGAGEDVIQAFRKRYPGRNLDALVELYSEANGGDFPDVYIGYFLHPLEAILEAESKGLPTKLGGNSSAAVIPFGSDGGGGLFLHQLDGTKVFHLLPGRVERNVYLGDPGRIRQVADDLAAFCVKLAQDFQAFANQREDWQYMVKA